MRTVRTADITEKVKDLCLSAAYDLEPDVRAALTSAAETERSPLGKDVLGQIIKNYEINKPGLFYALSGQKFREKFAFFRPKWSIKFLY